MSEGTTLFTYQGAGSTRLDKYLVECLPDFSRSQIQRLIKDGNVLVNGTPAGKTGLKVESGTKVQVSVPPIQPSELVPEAIPLDIIFENDDLMVVNKPAGMVVHPAAGHSSGTLVHAALAHAPEMHGIGGVKRPGVVHRLDKNTSGLILLAKNDKAHRHLQKQFKDRLVEKWYLALVDGHPPTPKGRIEAPIGRDPGHRKRMAAVSLKKGREAFSEYFTRESFPKHTLVDVHLLTGRTHQIRVHMAFIECPVVGDTVYGRHHSTVPLDRHFLHAARMSITLPGEDEPRQFEAPLPTDLETVLDDLRCTH